MPISDHLNGEINRSPFGKTFCRGFCAPIIFCSASSQKISGCGRPAALPVAKKNEKISYNSKNNLIKSGKDGKYIHGSTIDLPIDANIVE